MTIALWCVLVAALMPIVCAGIAKGGRADFDNANPRQWLDGLDGWRRRADAAQRNCFEAFPLFAAAALLATFKGAATGTVDLLAVLWLALRIAYVWAYVADRSTLRSALFALALAVAIAIFIAPLWAV